MARSRAEFEDEPDIEVPPVHKKARHTSDSFDDGHGKKGRGNGCGSGEIVGCCADGAKPSSFRLGVDIAGCTDGGDRGRDDGRAVSGDDPGSGRSESGIGDVVAKKRNKPWKVHARPGGSSMHNANLYRHYRPDFRKLASEYPETFGPHVTQDPDTGRATIDWKRPDSMRELTRVMLKHDFGIEWDVPLDRLCPPVPNRLNYICWLSDLMKLRRSAPAEDDDGDSDTSIGGMDSEAERNLLLFGTSEGLGGTDDEDDQEEGEDAAAPVDDNRGGRCKERRGRTSREKRCRGVDIGTGASCIYPLLGVKVMTGWSFLATETDAVSAEWAERNVRVNHLQDRIEVRVVVPSDTATGEGPGPLLTALTDGDAEDLDFCMANPPFFASEGEAGQNPDTATGAMAVASEVSCPGGEEAFVRAIIRDSLRLKKRVRWYTTMLGKKSNAKKLLRVLREAGVKNMRTTEFFQGRTVRWGLAWSFTSEGMVGDKVPDIPSVKVFSKKKASERTQQNLRNFGVPLLPRSTSSTSASGSETWSSPQQQPLVKVTIPANLPRDADDVVERLRRSLKAFRQADIAMDAINESDPAYFPDYSTCTLYSGSTTSNSKDNDNNGAIATTGKFPTLSDSAASAVDGVHSLGNPHAARRFRCVARSPSAGASSSTEKAVATSAAARARTGGTTAPLFAFDLEVHGAASWAGAAAAAVAKASVRVWARLEDGGDRGAFQRVWEALQHDVLRQNRRWRREMSRPGVSS